MKLEVTVNSGMAYLLSLAAIVGYALYIHATFNEFWLAIATLYGWHTGRRLWRQLKLPNGTTIEGPEEGATK